MDRLEKFERDLEVFFQEFLRGFKNLVEDFAFLADNHEVIAAVTLRFLEARARDLIDSYDSLLRSSLETFEEIILDENRPVSVEMQEAIPERKKQFKQALTLLVQRLNVKAELLNQDLEDLKSSQSELKKRLQEISVVTYEQIINKFKV
jgi:hypothetical protein